MTAHMTVVGSLKMDLVIRAPRIPRPGETLIGSAFRTVPGGKGANQALAAARLGADVSLVGRVGRDAFGEALLENLAADGIDRAFVTQDLHSATGVALIVVDDTGQNSIVVASGANMRLSPRDVEAAESAIAAADVVLTQLESPLDTVSRAAQIAHAHRVPVVLNPAPARPLPASLLSLVDVLIPNESETALLTGLPVEDQAQAAAAAAVLRNPGVGMVILTLGKRGALLAEAAGATHVPTFEVTPVDTTAAGDAFVMASPSRWPREERTSRLSAGATPPAPWPPPGQAPSRRCPPAPPSKSCWATNSVVRGNDSSSVVDGNDFGRSSRAIGN